MRKTFKLFMLGFALMFASLIKVNAEDYVAQINGIDYTTLEVAIANAVDGDTIELLSDITVTSTIVIKNEGTITINGNGNTISNSASKKVFEIYAEDKNADEEATLDITFSNIEIINGYGEGRAIDTRTANITLTIDSSTLTTTGSGNTQALTIGGPEGVVTVNVTNSTIDAKDAGYGIVTFNPTTLTIDNSTVTGYASLYMKGEVYSQGSSGSVVTITNNSVLTGKSDYSGDYNNFGTVALEDDGITINVENSTVEATGIGNASQVIFSQNSNTVVETSNVITVSGSSKLNVRPEGYVINGDDMDITVGIDVSSNLDIPVEYLPENAEIIEENGEYVVVAKKYDVTINTPENGTVTVNKEEAIVGETVTVTTTAKEGYVLKDIKVVDASNNEVTITDGKFVMPDSDVVITATFVEDVPVPNTGDNIIMFIVLDMFSLICLLFGLNKLRKVHN